MKYALLSMYILTEHNVELKSVVHSIPGSHSAFTKDVYATAVNIVGVHAPIPSAVSTVYARCMHRLIPATATTSSIVRHYAQNSVLRCNDVILRTCTT